MQRTRLYVDGPIEAGSEFVLRGDRARYIGKVLRLRPNDEITAFDGSGPEYLAVIETLGKDRVALSITARVDASVESPLPVHLLQGISRGERMDMVVQKTTELGVARITPVITDYTVVRLEQKRAEKRVRHWQGVASSACEQCGRNVIPVIDSPVTFRNWLGDNIADERSRIILRPGAAISIGSLEPTADGMTVLIGPEGGFSEAEYELAEATGFKPVGFGPRVLRTETAAIAALVALQTLYGDLAR